MSAFPGNPSPGELASADRKMAAVRAAVDQLLETPHPTTGDHTADLIQLASGPVIEAVISLERPHGNEPALIALAAELLLRALDKTSIGDPR